VATRGVIVLSSIAWPGHHSPHAHAVAPPGRFFGKSLPSRLRLREGSLPSDIEQAVDYWPVNMHAHRRRVMTGT
jgi:hypothetical protein